MEQESSCPNKRGIGGVEYRCWFTVLVFNDVLSHLSDGTRVFQDLLERCCVK